MLNRLHFTIEDVSRALADAGFVLRAEDPKFQFVAERLSSLAREHVRRELTTFADVVLEPTPLGRKQ